ESTVAIAVVTVQAEQEFKPLTESQVRTLEIPKEKLFENTGTRVFYQDKVSAGPPDPNAYSASVPAGKNSYFHLPPPVRPGAAGRDCEEDRADVGSERG